MTPITPEIVAKRKCTAHRSNGQPCSAYAIRGGTVCSVHGGRAPQVKRKAAERLRALVDPAINALEQIVNDPDHAQRLAAAREILDRAGVQLATETENGLRQVTWEEFAVMYRRRTAGE